MTRVSTLHSRVFSAQGGSASAAPLRGEQEIGKSHRIRGVNRGSWSPSASRSGSSQTSSPQAPTCPRRECASRAPSALHSEPLCLFLSTVEIHAPQITALASARFADALSSSFVIFLFLDMLQQLLRNRLQFRHIEVGVLL